jgi:large exoprotein involved in heme utilization and adhesion
VSVAVAGSALIANGGAISSDTSGHGKGGSVTLSANSLQIDGSGTVARISSEALSRGDAGSVNITVAGQASILNGGFVGSDTFGSGNGGSVTLSAGSLLLDGRGNGASISSFTQLGTGNANSVQVAVAGQATIANGGLITTSTAGAGKAGAATVSSGTLTVDGIGSGVFSGATANPGSSGQTGDVTVAASNSITLSNGGAISIENHATVPSPASIVPTTLSVVAPSITLNNAAITAASTGNIAASDIKIKFGSQLYLDPSFVTTSSVNGNGGSIFIQGLGTIFLNNSELLTSVSGLLNGNAGNISLAAQFLVMNGGFIQANTAAPLAAGGNISIGVNAIVPSGGVLNVGGNTPLTFNPAGLNVNAIQAAAPTGVSGSIEVSAPVLNASGSLVGLTSNVLSNAGFGRSPCSSSGGSSLAQTGRGGLPVSSSDLLRAERENSHPSGALKDVGAPFSEQTSSNRFLAACR